MRKILPILILIVAALLVTMQVGCKKNTPEELKSWLEITDVETKWVSKYYQPWPPKLILVPAIQFRVKNVSSRPLRYIYFNAIFRFKDDRENLGDAFLAAIRNKPVMPGEKSESILLKSNFGVEGSTKAQFINNPQWKIAEVRLFFKKGSSGYVFLGEYDISRKIDFEEPEPVGIEKKQT
ncbi:MAG: hypothetical protein ACE5WD_00770 [Candidatus Aminicenantia bacterium]